MQRPPMLWAHGVPAALARDAIAAFDHTGVLPTGRGLGHRLRRQVAHGNAEVTDAPLPQHTPPAPNLTQMETTVTPVTDPAVWRDELVSRLVDSGHLTKQEGDDEHGHFWQIGVIGHGPVAGELAEQVATEISEWNKTWGNNSAEPSIRMAVGDAREQLTAAESRFVMDKPRSRLVVDWPRRS